MILASNNPRVALTVWCALALFVLALLQPRITGAIDVGDSAGFDPTAIPMQRPVIPEREPWEPGDKDKVVYFFSFNCIFCMKNDIAFWQWGLSLPKPIEFQAVPLIATGDDHITMARAFYAAELVDRQRIVHFMTKVYESLLISGADPKSLQTYLAAATAVGIDPAQYEKTWNGNKTMHALIAARKRFTHYQPDSTPSLLLNGQYLISPDLTNGDYSLFFQLANGLLSRYLEAKGLHQ